MKKRILATILALALLGAVLLTICFLHSPTYALKQTAKAIQVSGMAGLQSHLTNDAAETLDLVAALEEQFGLESKLLALLSEEQINQFLSDMHWTLEAVDRTTDGANAVVSFDLGDILAGELSLSMVREDGTWKIQDVSLTNLSKPLSA